jgi:hypothetical protein
MTYKEIATLVDGIGYPYAYYQFEKETAKDPPFICFYYPENNDFLADNTNYAHITELTIELYTDNKDFAAEAAVEDALTTAGIVYEKDETYIDSERMYMITYTTEVLINGQS